MRNILILIIFLLPLCASAQILRAYGVIEVGSLPTSSATGPKFAYRPADSSFYRWVSGSTWVKINEPDTLYLKQLSSTTALVDGDTIDISTYLLKSDTSSMLAAYIKLVGYGLIKTGQTIRVDTTSPNGLATRLFAKTLPTTIAANYIATSNGTNLVARNLFDNNTYAGVISRPWKFGEYTTAGLPTGVTGYHVYNTTIGGPGWYDATRWNYIPKAVKSAFTSTYIPFTNSSGQFDENANLVWDNSTVLAGGGGTGQMRVGGSNDGGYGRVFINGRVSFRREFIMDRSAGGFGAYFTMLQRNSGESGTFSTATGLTGQAELYTYNAPLVIGTFSGGSSFGRFAIVTGRVNRIFIDENGLISMGITGGGVVASTRLGVIGTGTGGTTYTARFDNSTGSNYGFNLQDDGRAAFGQLGGDASAKVTITSTTQGFLPPRWTSAQRTAISLPATGLFGYQTDATEGLYAKYASGWKRHLVEGDVPTVNIYTGDGTFGAGRIGTLTDSFRIRFGSSDLFRLKSNGVAHFNMPTENNSFVITSTPNENYNNYRGNVFLVGTTSDGDTTTGIRRNNHEASYFSGMNLVEGGNSVYYDAVAGYGNIVRGNVPGNIIFGIYNTINSIGEVGAYGSFNTITGRNTTVIGRNNTVSADNGFVVGRFNTVTQNNAFVYGTNIATTNSSLHGFGVLTPTEKIDVGGNARVRGFLRVDGKLKVGSDSSFVHDPNVDSTYIKGNTKIQSGNLTIEKVSGTPYLNIIAQATSGNQEAGIYLKSRGQFSPIIEFDATASTSSGRSLPFYNYNTSRGGSQVFVIGSEPGQFGARSYGRFSVFDTLTTTRRFSFFSDGTAIFDNYNSSGDFVPSIVGEAPTDFFLTNSASTGKVMQRKMRQTTSVTDSDLTITASNLQDAQDYHVWATCSISASDSVVVSLPTPSSTYQGQVVYVYGDGRNATPDRDVYVKCTGKLWYGNSAPTAESYFQVTSLSGGINSRTAAFICAYNGSNYYWQLMKSHD